MLKQGIAVLSMFLVVACGQAKSGKEVEQVRSSSSEKQAQVKIKKSASSQSKQVSSSVSESSSTSKIASSDGAKSRSESVEDQQNQAEKTGKRARLQIQGQVQRKWNTCVPTVVSMMLSRFGKFHSQEELALQMGTDESFGTHNDAAIRVLNRHLFGYETPTSGQAGYRLERVDAVTQEVLDLFAQRLIKDIDDGYPVYYTVNNAVLYPGISHGEHNLVGLGYELDQKGRLAYVTYWDPSPLRQDSQYGGLKKASPEELLTAMQACQEPNYAW